MSTAPDQPGPGRPTQPAAASAHTEKGPAPVTSGSEPRVRTGGCLCGHIQYEVTGDPDDPHLCACRHETRISGAPAVLWVGFPRKSLRWVGPGGEPTWYASWPTLHRGFCPRCGSQLVSDAYDSAMVMVTAFSLDDPTGTTPVGFSFRDEAVPWMTVQLASEPAEATP
ncbi:GFA family protein [Streptomyces sp. NPDC057302]|uniref:GFA family protein n=1 Tax=Streptomyces sp. NPDC057302 TaxID=3346094 RepID=UPI0036335D22